MSLYYGDNGTVKKSAINYYNHPIFFGYYNDGSGMKKFYDLSEAVEKIIVYPRFLYRDTSTPYFENATEAKISDLSGYGSLTVGNNYIQIVSNRNNSSIWVMVGSELKFKGYGNNYGYYDIDSICGYNKRFDASILKYVLSVTGYLYFRGSSSVTSYGYGMNNCFGVDVVPQPVSTSSTVTKTYNENSTVPEGLAFAYVGAGRESGSQNITSKLTFNSFSFNGVSIPIVCENRLS